MKLPKAYETDVCQRDGRIVIIQVDSHGEESGVDLTADQARLVANELLRLAVECEGVIDDAT